MTIDRSDLRYIPIEPNECPFCPGIKHWPHNCPNQPEAREKARVTIKKIIENIPRLAPSDRREGG